MSAQLRSGAGPLTFARLKWASFAHSCVYTALLVSAFAGRDLILRAYDEAMRERYRFFSYGDCMLIL